MAKTIYSGLEDSGKSLMLAITAVELVQRNAKWFKKTGVARPIRTNLEFKDDFIAWAAENGIEIKVWKDLEELPTFSECDLFIDEIGAYFDSRTFKDLPLDIRLWLAQASKLGVDIYGSAQDFAQVDLSFRRLTTHLYEIKKLIGSRRPAKTKPRGGRVWGICSMKELDPVGYDEQKKKFNNQGIIPSFFLIRKQFCEIFDTNKRIAKSKPPPFKHISRPCAQEGCTMKLHEVVDGKVHRIQHV